MPEAIAAFKKAAEHRQKLAAAFRNKPFHRSELGKLLNDLGDVQASSKKPAEARASYLQALGVWRSLITDFPKEPDYRRDFADTYRDLAWVLATCPDPAVRNFRQAFTFAQQAVLADGAFHGTLGVAHYRAGKWKDAIAELEKSIERNKANTARDLFFLAMAHWQLAERDQARKHYAQAVEWMEKNQPKDDELRRFRAEAAELLGINMSEPDRTRTKP